jgi:hypothetical protein
MNCLKPIFIGGTGRSGTTILKRVLSRHSKVICLRDELRVLVDPDGALDLISALTDHWSPYKADLAIHNFQRIMRACARSKTTSFVYLEKVEKTIARKMGLAPRKYLGAGFGVHFGYANYHHRLSQLIHDLSYYAARGNWAGSPWQFQAKIFETEPRPRQQVERIIAEFFNDLYAQVAPPEKEYWLDDTPSNLLHADQLLHLFPEMRLIHIYRDPRDVLASYLHFSWGGDNFETTARRLAGIYQRWQDVRKSFPADRVLEIRLEQLSEAPRDGLTSICNFLGMDFEEGLASIPLNKVNAGRWQNEIPREKTGIVEEYLGKYVSWYGY